MRKIIISIGVAFFMLLVAVYVAFPIWSLNKIPIEYLIGLCLERPESRFYPDGIEEFYMLNFRGNDKDMERLIEGCGLCSIFAHRKDATEQEIKYAKFFIEKGFDVNSTDGAGLSALHHAAMNNQLKAASFLLSNGADKNLRAGYHSYNGEDKKTMYTGKNAVELAKYMSEKDGQDRSEIIEMLSKTPDPKGQALK